MRSSEKRISFLEGKFKPSTSHLTFFPKVPWFLSLWKVNLPLFTHFLWDYCSSLRSSLLLCFATYSKVEESSRIAEQWLLELSGKPKGTKRMKAELKNITIVFLQLYFVSYLYEQLSKDDTCPFCEAWLSLATVFLTFMGCRFPIPARFWRFETWNIIEHHRTNSS